MPKFDWYATCFPSRYSERLVVMIWLTFGPKDRDAFPQTVDDIRRLLIEGGILAESEPFPRHSLPEDRYGWYSSLLVQTALLLEQKAGHRVDFTSVECTPLGNRCLALLEHAHCDIGMTVVKYAAEVLTGKRKSLEQSFRTFSEFARERNLPQDVEAVMKAARRRDVPCIRLEHNPHKRADFDWLTRGRCVRRNGLLMLGQGPFRRFLDGTFGLEFCEDLASLLDDRPTRRQTLLKLGLPLGADSDEGQPGGTAYRLYAVNGEVLALIRATDGQAQLLERLHGSLAEQALDLGRELRNAPLAVSFESADITRPLAESGGRFVDFDLAPTFDELAASDRAAFEKMAAGIVDWLFPAPGNARMPTIAVTGTNGKTTTSRMLSHLFKCAGRKPGLVCTDGVYLDGQEVIRGDFCADTGHFHVLSSREVDVAVLECHHIGIIYRGFAFEWCDVAVCLNVTPDHIGVADIDTVEKMAEVKQAVPQRARRAAVLNADDPNCLAMVAAVTADHACLVSMEQTAGSLLSRHAGRVDLCCVTETVAGDPWIVIHDGNRRLPLLGVGEIPATFGGRARFNLCNAMHAVMAAYAAGLDADTLRRGMRTFEMSYEKTPGRLNFYGAHPFGALVDFAHNTDGLEKLGAFVDQLDVQGRKILMFQVRSDVPEAEIRQVAAAAGGHFDHYVCRPHPHYRKLPDDQVLALISAGLLDSGRVERHQITAITDPAKAVAATLEMGRAGDLLVFTPGAKQREETWRQIVSFSPRTERE